MPSAFAVPTRTVNKYQQPPTERLLATMKLPFRLASQGAASFIYTGMSPSLYSAYRFDWYGVVEASAGGQLQFGTSSDGGVTYGALWSGSIMSYGNTAASSSFTIRSAVNLCLVSSAAQFPSTGSLTFAYSFPRGTGGATDAPVARWHAGNSWDGGAPSFNVHTGAAFYDDITTEINTLRFTNSAGLLRRGALCVYGISGYTVEANDRVPV